MNLVTPDTGLLFWMVLIFGIVFFILAKWGFPVITGMVEKRNGAIEKSLQDAKDIEARMAAMVKEHEAMLAGAREEQAAILKEASESRDKLLSEAKGRAQEEADKIVAEARVQIEAERESAKRDVRREAALLAVGVAEKILRERLSGKAAQREYLERLVKEVSEMDTDVS